MNHSEIPEAVIKAAAKVAKRNPDMTFKPLPLSAVEGITVGPRGAYKPGLKVWIIDGEERTVFLGSFTEPVETKLPEFTLLLESGCQFYGQYGRDFVFNPVAP